MMTNPIFRFHLCCAVATLLFLSPFTQAQEQSFPDLSGITTQKIQLPDNKAVRDAQKRTRSSMGQVDIRLNENKVVLPDMPQVESLPRSLVPADDLSALAERYKQVGSFKAKPSGLPDLFIMVSFSMPEGALDKLVEQAERAGAALVFRGAKGDSMVEMGKAIEKILKGRSVQTVIHPPAFQQFSIKRVPVFVLADQEAGRVLDDGCAKLHSYIKVSGDVTLDYALEYIERHSPEWAGTAEAFRSRIVRGL